MSERADATPARQKKPRRRWLQFSVRSALLAILAVALLMAWLTRPETLVEPLPGGVGRIERQVVRDEKDQPRNHGRWRLFDADGRMLVDGAYRGSKPHGRWTYYHAAGEWFVAEAPTMWPDEEGSEPPAEADPAGVRVPADAEAIVARWIGRLRASSAAERAEAAWALARIGPPAVLQVAALLTDGDPLVRRAAAETLAAIGPPAAGSIAALTAAVADEDAAAALAAVEALGRIGPAAKDALPAILRRAPQAADDDEREIFLAAQASIDPADPAAIRELLLLRPANGSDILPQPVSAGSSLYWPNVYAQRPALIPALATALRDGDLRVARLAVRALVVLRCDDPAAADGLCAALRDPREEVRLEMIASLDNIYGPLGDVLLEALTAAAAKDESAEVRAAAMEASEGTRFNYPMSAS